MAEARQAVGLTVTADGGLKFDFGEDVLHLIFHAGQRSAKKRFARFITKLKTGIFPIKVEVFLGNVTFFTALHFAEIDPTFGLSSYLLSMFNVTNWILSSILTGVLASLILVVSIRYLLRLLFSYQGWMFLSRKQMKNPPLSFKAWTLFVKLLTSIQNLESGNPANSKPMLCSYQGSLPYLPLPKLSQTLEKHLESMRPILSEKDFEEMKNLSNDFETNLAQKLQRYLLLKWIWSENYVSDWWEEYVYLRGRSALMINSNYYAIDALFMHPTQKQAARAANIVHLSFNFRRALLRQEASPLVVQGLVPMCSRQYDRFFNTCRIPGEVKDILQHEKDATHVAVMYKGKFYRMGCYSKGRLLNPAEMQIQIQEILDDNSSPDVGEDKLAVLTASNRTIWAQTREKFFRKGLNRTSLDVIEKAAFVLVLDDYEYDYDKNDETKLNHFARMMLHGRDGADRWFDKSFCIIVGSNGRIGLNAEHSWADAPVVGHFWEYVLAYDLKLMGYSKSGDCLGTVTERPAKASRLRWEIADECLQTIQTCLKSSKLLVEDLDLFLLVHSAYGKGFVKTCNLSPDAYIQMALQLAYYRDMGRFCLTYEASMTRLFREGRTETVRPCTTRSAAWVRAMEDPNSTRKERIDLLQVSSLNHQRLYQEAMTGQGVDRHLFCLYVVSKYLEIDSPFLTRVLSEPWRLSTSQTPVRGDYLDPRLNPDIISAGGGFGPVADDGYGVSYIIVGEDTIFFHVSAKKSSPQTDATRFARRIEKAMSDLKSLHSK